MKFKIVTAALFIIWTLFFGVYIYNSYVEYEKIPEPTAKEKIERSQREARDNRAIEQMAKFADALVLEVRHGITYEIHKDKDFGRLSINMMFRGGQPVEIVDEYNIPYCRYTNVGAFDWEHDYWTEESKTDVRHIIAIVKEEFNIGE